MKPSQWWMSADSNDHQWETIGEGHELWKNPDFCFKALECIEEAPKYFLLDEKDTKAVLQRYLSQDCDKDGTIPSLAKCTKDREFWLEMCKADTGGDENFRTISVVPKEYLTKDFMRELVEVNPLPLALYFASGEFKDIVDEEIIQRAIEVRLDFIDAIEENFPEYCNKPAPK